MNRTLLLKTLLVGAIALALMLPVAMIRDLVSVLRSAGLGLAFGAALSSLYAMLYALLKAEDYALLGGSLVLFGLLAAVMFTTRRVDWYSLTAPRGVNYDGVGITQGAASA